MPELPSARPDASALVEKRLLVGEVEVTVEMVKVLPVFLFGQILVKECLGRQLSGKLTVLACQRVFEGSNALSASVPKLPSGDKDTDGGREARNVS